MAKVLRVVVVLVVLVLHLHCKTASQEKGREVSVHKPDDDLALAGHRAVSVEVMADTNDPTMLSAKAYLKMTNRVRTIKRPRRNLRGRRVTAPM